MNGQRRADAPAGAIVDLDGTMLRSTEPISGAREGIEGLRAAGIDVLYVSNTTSKSRAECVRRLQNMGVDATYDDVITAASATASYLSSNGFEDAYVIGDGPLFEEISDAGISIPEIPEDADVLVVGKDNQFDYDKLTNALRALDDETPFVATNLDRTSPTSTGEVPGTGAIVGAVEGTTGRSPDVVVGKPHEYLARAALEKLELRAADCCIIGDSLEIDVRMGAEEGMTTVLVLSGVSTRADIQSAPYEPDIVVETLSDISAVLTC